MNNLSIVIPTKARTEKVYRQIENVNKQIKGLEQDLKIELLIVENFSSDLLDPARISNANWILKIESADLGGNHNFCNAILAASGEYVWVLGDDDELLEGAVSFMANLADKKENDCIIVNDLDSGVYMFEPTDQEALFTQSKNLGQLIHISGYMVRREAFLSLCHDSILYQSTFMPQLIYALNCLKFNKLCLVDKTLFTKKVLQEKVVTDLYFVSALVARGLDTLEIFIDYSARKSWLRLVRRTRKNWLTPKGILYELAKYYKDDPTQRRVFFRKSIRVTHFGLPRFVLYYVIGNIILSSNFLSSRYVELYEHLRGFSVNFRPTIKFHT